MRRLVYVLGSVLINPACGAKREPATGSVDANSVDAQAPATKDSSRQVADALLPSMSFGSNHGCVVTQARAVKCWGANDSKKLGAQKEEQSRTPVPVAGLERGVQSVHASMFFNCALVKEGAWCWGGNWLGQLGRGDKKAKDSPLPAPVRGLESGVKMLSLAGNTACAVTGDGGVRCWGDNEAGQLGDGTEKNRFEPVQVLGLDAGATQVATGGTQTCALLKDGKVSCWGARFLSDGLRPKYSAKPLLVTGLAEAAVQLAAGSDFACALGSSGKVYCWGWSTLGGSVASAEPVLVPDIGAAIVRISAAGNGACAETNAGDVWCWGLHAPGSPASQKPRLVSELKGVKLLALGASLGGALVGDKLLVWPPPFVPEQSTATLGIAARPL